MFRICLLAAALLLTGCSEPKRDPLAIGSEVFLNYRAVSKLREPDSPNQTPMWITKGTKVRIVDWHSFERIGSTWRAIKLEVLVLEGEHAGKIITVGKDDVFFAP